jgi:hypothetical protein
MSGPAAVSRAGRLTADGRSEKGANSRSVSSSSAGPSYIAVIETPKPPNGRRVSRILHTCAPASHSRKSGSATNRKSAGVTAYRLVGPGQTCRSAISLVGRVEMWRGGGRDGMSVTAPFVWRCPSNRAVAPFPHPARRTGRADLPHPAPVQDLTPSLTPRCTPARSQTMFFCETRQRSDSRPGPARSALCAPGSNAAGPPRSSPLWDRTVWNRVVIYPPKRRCRRERPPCVSGRPSIRDTEPNAAVSHGFDPKASAEPHVVSRDGPAVI